MQGKLIIGSLWLAVWGVASPLGALIGAGIGGVFQDKVGRKWSLLIAAIISAIAVALCFICDFPTTFNGRRVFFTLAKLLQGIAIGQIMVTTQTYMSEILPPKLRGPVLAFFPIFTLLGQLLGAVVLNSQIRVPGHRSYRTCFASQWVISSILIIFCFMIPESPTWLIRKDRMSQALRAQKRLNKPDMNSEASIEQLRISIIAEEEIARTQTYSDCFRGINLRRTWIVSFANMLPMLFGLVLLSKASYFLQIIGMEPSDSTLFLIVGIAIGLLANIGSIWTLNVCGRRPLIINGMAILTLVWLGMGIAGVFAGPFTVWWIAGSMMFTIFVAGLSCWPASYAVGAETSSLQLRAKSIGIGWMTSTLLNCVFTIILPYIYNPGKNSGGLKGKTCFVFAGCCVVACVGAWYYIPEMKGRSVADIDRMFAQRLPTRSFERWTPNESVAGQVTSEDLRHEIVEAKA